MKKHSGLSELKLNHHQRVHFIPIIKDLSAWKQNLNKPGWTVQKSVRQPCIIYLCISILYF